MVDVTPLAVQRIALLTARVSWSLLIFDRPGTS